MRYPGRAQVVISIAVRYEIRSVDLPGRALLQYVSVANQEREAVTLVVQVGGISLTTSPRPDRHGRTETDIRNTPS